MSVNRLRRQWNAHGQRNALTAILTRHPEEPAWNLNQFLETGRHQIADVMANAERLVPSLERQRALDFGCGIGRLTRALADHFEEVVGVDISDSMIAQAQALNVRPDRILYQLNVDPDLRRFPSGHFNLVCTWIVLQHMAPTLIRDYIAELVRVLAAGGLLVFQLPDANVEIEVRSRFIDAPVSPTPLKRRVPPWVVRLYRRIKYCWHRRSRTCMAMHGLSSDQVIALIDHAGGRLLEIQPDASHGTPCAGFSYWVTR
jgi:SAM-dependent methyltransferase